MKSYKVIYQENPFDSFEPPDSEKFEKKVQEYLNKGWKLHGTPNFTDKVYTQAMIFNHINYVDLTQKELQ